MPQQVKGTWKMNKKEVILYTDGACSGNPGVGGWAAILMYKEHKKEVSGAEEETTNNRMELTAIIEGLHLLKEPCIVNVYSDSAYAINAINEGWLFGWQNNGWRTSGKDDVKNVDLWQELLNLMKTHEIKFNKVKGHADNEFNNRCDKLAVGAYKELQKKIVLDAPPF